MYYENFENTEYIQEAENNNEFEQISNNQPTEDLPKFNRNNILEKKINYYFRNYHTNNERNNYSRKIKEKENINPMVSNVYSSYKTQIDDNKNYSFRNESMINYNENKINKNETEINYNYITENNYNSRDNQKNNIFNKYTIQRNYYQKQNTPLIYEKDSSESGLFFSYNDNNFSNTQNLMEEKNNLKNVKIENRDYHFRSGYGINNRNNINKETDYFYKKINNYKKYKNDNKENISNNIYSNNLDNENINSQNNYSNASLKKSIRKEILNTNNDRQEKKDLYMENDYFYNYEFNTNDDITTKAKYDAEFNKMKYNNYPNYTREIKENENDNKKYNLNKKEISHINDLRTLQNNPNIIKNQLNKNKNTNTNNNINNRKMNIDKKYYYNSSMNHLILDDKKEDSTRIFSSYDIHQKKFISASQQNFYNSNDINKIHNYNNNTQKESNVENIKIKPIKKEVKITIKNNKNYEAIIQENDNMNTLESNVLRSMDKDEEILTLKLEEEQKKLEELTREKQRLLLEENERREKLRKEIETKQIEQLEKKKMMRIKYDEKLKKRKIDEERLRKIKEEQQKQLKDINELRNKRKYDEQNLILLKKNLMNKSQGNDYIIERNNNDISINKINENIQKDNSNFCYYKNNIIKNNENNNLNNNIYQEKNINEKSNFEGIENNLNEEKENIHNIGKLKRKIYRSSYNLLNKSEINNNNENKIIYKYKNKRININKLFNKKDVQKTFSPNIRITKNEKDINPLNEVDNDSKLISNQIYENHTNSIIEEKNYNKEVNEIHDKEEINKEQIIENKNIEIEKEIINESLDKKIKYQNNIDIKNKLNNITNNKNKLNNSKKDSSSIIKELRELTSKLTNEVEKKIELFNKNKLLLKNKSSPDLQFSIKKEDQIKEEFNQGIEIDKKKNDKNKNLERNNKYIQLINETKTKLYNLINNNQKKTSKISKKDNSIFNEDLKKHENISQNNNSKNVNKIFEYINKKKQRKINDYKTLNNINKTDF